MKARVLILLSVLALLVSCDLKKLEEANRVAEMRIDSLSNKLVENRKMTAIMTEVGALLDSIDANRKVLRTSMNEGTDYQSYSDRMREINKYVKATQSKIESLEKASRNNNDATYAQAIKKMRHDLETRNHELAALKEQVELYKGENEGLIKTVSLQKVEIQDKLKQLKAKQEEAAQLEAQVKQLLVQSKLDEGEAYFARAVAVEESAHRTHFAPRKKKSTRREALELYKLARFYGKDEAQAKIDQLEKML